MASTDIPLQLDLQGTRHRAMMGRRRSNSQSQVVPMPSTIKSTPKTTTKKRNQVQYFVTLAPLNDTFIKKHIPVAMFPDTTKLGRPTATKNKPEVTNGYFELRVLSRTHAQIYIDAHGRLMLQDLGSSNGTFVNDIKLGSEAVEIKVDDVVCLGFNVQSELNHKQITLKIEKINVVGGSTSELYANHMEYKHMSYIEDVYSQVMKKKPKQKASVSFESALFGDVSPTIEDSLLGLGEGNAGIFNNAQVNNNSGVFGGVIDMLVADLHMAKKQSQTLSSLETFFANYERQAQELNTSYLDTQFKRTLDDMHAELRKGRSTNSKLKDKYRHMEVESNNALKLLNMRIRELELENARLYASRREGDDDSDGARTLNEEHDKKNENKQEEYGAQNGGRLAKFTERKIMMDQHKENNGEKEEHGKSISQNSKEDKGSENVNGNGNESVREEAMNGGSERDDIHEEINAEKQPSNAKEDGKTVDQTQLLFDELLGMDSPRALLAKNANSSTAANSNGAKTSFSTNSQKVKPMSLVQSPTPENTESFSARSEKREHSPAERTIGNGTQNLPNSRNFKITLASNQPKSFTTTQDTPVAVHGLFSELRTLSREQIAEKQLSLPVIQGSPEPEQPSPNVSREVSPNLSPDISPVISRENTEIPQPSPTEFHQTKVETPSVDHRTAVAWVLVAVCVGYILVKSK